MTRRNGPDGLVVVPFADESIERSLKRFRRLLERAGVMGELKRRRHYLTPRERQRQKSAIAKYRKAKHAPAR